MNSRPDPARQPRSPLGLGPLEAAIMQVAWQAGDWLTVRDIRARMDRPPAYTTVATVAGVLCGKDLLHRRRTSSQQKQGPQAWCYGATQPASEHIGSLIAALLNQSPDPMASLAYALVTTQSALDGAGLSPA